MFQEQTRDFFPKPRCQWEGSYLFRRVTEHVVPLLVVSRHEMPVDVLRFVEVHEVHLLDAEGLQERITHEVHDVHEVLDLCARKEMKVAHRSLPRDDCMPTRDRE